MATKEVNKGLVSQRSVIKRNMTRLEQWLDQPDQPIVDVFEVNARMKTLNRILESYDNIQSQIEANDDSDKDRDTFEPRVEDAEAKLQRKKHDLNVSQTQELINASFQGNSTINVTVENQDEMSISKPKPFNGEDYMDWPVFFNSFKSLIDESKSKALTPVKKFSILRECVKGKAYDAIAHLPLNEDGYTETKSILVKRYDKKRLLFESLIQKLLQIPKADNETALRDMYDKAISLTKALEALPATKEQIGLGILIQILLGKVDKSTLAKWEEKGSNASQFATWTEFVTFLDERCNTIEAITFAHKNQLGSSSKAQKHGEGTTRTKPNNAYLVDANGTPNKCKCCDETCFTLAICIEFLNLSAKERYDFVKRNKICTRCLVPTSHTFRDCHFRCAKPNCGGKHHILLHDENLNKIYKKQSAVQTQTTVQSTQSALQPIESTQLTVEIKDDKQVAALKVSEQSKRSHLLATAVVKIKNGEGEYCLARALIDSGSMVNFVTKRFASMARLKFVQQKTDMKGMFAEQKLSHITSIQLKSCTTDFATEMEAVILPKFDDCHPCLHINIEESGIPQNIVEGLADPQFNAPQHIDLILGVGISYEILSVGQVQLKNGLILQKTLLGWIAAGDIAMTGKSYVKNSCFLASLTSSEADLLKKFWELEEAKRPVKVLAEEEIFCEKIFAESVARNSEGRFIVKIPFKHDPVVLGESRSAAESYLRSIERKLNQQPVLKNMYEQFLKEYEEMGHMTEVPEEKVLKAPKMYNYIPHHYVLKWDSSTTKLRVVFHASFNTSSGHSFNSIQCVGPTLQPNLFDILLRARLDPILICADVSKMYRQILIDPAQRCHQCIIWRRQDGSLVTFELNTVTYGTASASFNAVRCLVELARLHPEFKLAAKAVLNSMYIDDIVSGASSVKEGKQLVKELNELLSLGCFPLRKWCSNSREALADLQDEHKEPLVAIGDETITKTLGLNWNPETDSFMFLYKPDADAKPWTKRRIISTVSKIFDPLGLVGPVIAKAKMLCQHLWKLGLNWDESIDQKTVYQWSKMLDEMNDLTELRFPRFVLSKGKPQRVELHCFADASTKAYGAVFYIKCINQDGAGKVTLLCSKSKVAPVKTVTLPRLELCGALLLADLYTTVTTAINIQFDKVYCWLDSRVALRWVLSSPHLWKDFIAARTTKIQAQTPNCEWRHVPGDINPADIISRGASPKALVANLNWFQGPQFLMEDEQNWTFKAPEPVNDDDDIMEAKQETFALVAHTPTDLVLQLKSTEHLSKIRRIFGYVNRFINGNCKGIRDISPLTVIDIEGGLKLAVKTVQVASFAEQRQCLIKGKELRVSDPIAKLAPFIDEEGLIRVGGRLKNAPHLSYNEKYPILLPKGHPLVRAIFTNYHSLNMHPGPQALLALVRGKFWPLSGKAMATLVFRSCKICSLAKPMLFKQIMGNLPQARISFERCFETTGVDLFGPFIIKQAGRGSRRVEMYAVIFVCFVTKAVYITYVENASTASFLNAFQRFISRRGTPTHMWSDNATNFTGANEVMKHIDWKQVDFWCRDYKNLQWHFIPPRSPHFGGLWEAAVKLAKKSLLKVVSKVPIHFDLFNTLLARIEGEINSRPITPLVSNPGDDRHITPSDFLTGTAITTLPEPTLQNFPSRKGNLVKHWQQLNEILMHWRKRWSTELLQSYQIKGKWFVGSSEVKLDCLVFMPNPSTTQSNWLIARIKKLHAGNDSMVRVVTVVTSDGSEYKRSIMQLAPVPINESSENDG